MIRSITSLHKHRSATLAACWLLAATMPHIAQSEPITGDGYIPTEVIEGQLVPVTGEIGRIDLQVLFRLGSAELTQAGQKQLDALASALRSNALKDASISINGHTDASGPAELNKTLSENRAQSVLRYLVDQNNLPEAQFEALGYGEERLLPTIDPNSKKQRRVEIIATLPNTGAKPKDDTNKKEPSGFVIVN